VKTTPSIQSGAETGSLRAAQIIRIGVIGSGKWLPYFGASGVTAGRTANMQKITTFLWFDDQAEEAANFYVSLFKNSKITNVSRYPEGSPGPVGKVMTTAFELDGQEFIALNGGPQFPFTEAISLFVNCETQREVDELWEKLSDGGEKSQCGWLKDKFGLSWQIVPTALGRLLGDKDPEKAKRVMQAMLQMSKIDIAELERAREEPSPTNQEARSR
jgi:predicted 3-demethylubiquinone-9 3-methyltransferase (glyoxalase superfamily)